MKKLFSLVPLVFAGLMVVAQPEEKLSWGIRAGYTRSMLSPDYTDNMGYKHEYSPAGGFRFGGFLILKTGKKTFGQADLLLSTKRFADKNTFPNGAFTPVYKVSIIYLEVPLSLLYKMPVKKSFLYTGGGIIPAYKGASDNSYSSSGFDLGLNVAAGFQNASDFSLQLTYTKSLIPVKEEYNAPGNQLFSTIGLTIGYIF